MFRLVSRGLSGAALALALAASTANAQVKPVELRVSLFTPPNHVMSAALREWGSALEEASKGEVKIRLFPGEQLGKAADQYELVSSGAADAAWVVPGYQPGRFPIAALGEAPFVFGNSIVGSEVFDAWYRPFAAKEMPDVKYCMGFVQDPGVLHSRRQINNPEELKGLKVRVPTATVGRFLGKLGASVISIPAPEARDAVERGIVDVVGFGWGTANVLGVSKAAKYHMDAPFYSVPTVIAINPEVYNRLSASGKAALDSTCNSTLAGKLGKIWGEFEKAGRDKLEAGHAVYPLSPAATQIWIEASKPLLDDLFAAADAKGINGRAEFENLTRLLKAKNASGS